MTLPIILTSLTIIGFIKSFSGISLITLSVFKNLFTVASESISATMISPLLATSCF